MSDDDSQGSSWWNIGVLGLLSVAFAMLLIQVFGETVSTKFNSANNAVVSRVTFGSGGGGGTGGGGGARPRAESGGAGAPSVSDSPERGASRGAGDREAQRRVLREEGPRPEVNRMKQTSEDARSTFAADVDTGSYTLARRKIESGRLPAQRDIRVEEFVNYFDYGYPQPESGPFGVQTEAAPSPFASDERTHLLRVGVQGRRIREEARKPVHLTFLVDVSGSMDAPDRLELAQRSLKLLTRNLNEGDTVALATYAGRTEKVLEPTDVGDADRILSAIDRLDAGGSTAMGDGMEMAYDLATDNYAPEHTNRVVVVSDGNANVGATSHQGILEQVREHVDEGVKLSTIGFGTGNYRDTTMEQLADEGNGNYYYIDGMAEARKVFGRELNGTLEVIAKDVKLQVEFDPSNVPNYRLVGYENRDVADRDFRNEDVDAGEIGAGHSVTALYEIELADEVDGRLGTVRVRHKPPKGSDASEQAFPIRPEHVRGSLTDASSSFQFAASVASFAELLRGSPYAEGLAWSHVEEVARSSTGERPLREELVALIERASRLES